MTNKTYTSVIDTEVYDNGMDYLDVNIYVTCPDGSDWRRTVSMNKKSGNEWASVTCYAGKHGCFEEAAEVAPLVVSSMFEDRMIEAKQLLRAAHNRQTNVKDHAEEMLKVLKSVYVDLRDRYDPPSYILNDMKERVKQVIDKVEGRK